MNMPIYGGLAAVLLSGIAGVAAIQAELIPQSVWAQLPVVVLFSIVVIALAKLYFDEQRRIRQAQQEDLVARNEARRQERKEDREIFFKMIDDQNRAISTLLEVFAKTQAAAIDDALDKVVAQYYQVEKKLNE
jgi:hypothetical protein